MASAGQGGMPIDIGIDEGARKEIAHGLSRLLADTYTLYLQTHNVSAFRCAHQARANIWFALIQGSYIFRILVMIDNFF